MMQQSWLEAKLEVERTFTLMRLRQLENMVRHKLPEVLIDMQVASIVSACGGQKGEE